MRRRAERTVVEMLSLEMRAGSGHAGCCGWPWTTLQLARSKVGTEVSAASSGEGYWGVSRRQRLGVSNECNWNEV
jgi:hypothetical protein